MARITDLSVDGFRSIEHVRLRFPAGSPLVLVGENNVGKTNLVRALDLLLGERWPGSTELFLHDFHGRDSGSCVVRVTGSFDEMTDGNGDPIWNLTYEHNDLPDFSGELMNGRRARISKQTRSQCQCILVNADRQLSRQLSYVSEGTMLAKLMRRFHDALMKDSDRVALLESHFRALCKVFGGVPEFAAFHKTLEREVELLSTSVQYGLGVDFAAYDPRNYFRALRIMPNEDGEVRPFDELGTGQEQILPVGFAYAYATAFAAKGEDIVLVIEEPEAHLHPLAQQWLARELHRFHSSDGVQVVITTHSPYFVNVSNLDGLALVRKTARHGATYVKQLDAAALTKHCLENGADKAKTKSDGIFDFYAAGATDEIRAGFFARAIVLVEGRTESLALPELMRRHGVDSEKLGIAFISVEGKGSLAKWWRFFTAYEIPTFVIFDNDKGDDHNGEKRKDALQTLGLQPDQFDLYLAADLSDFAAPEKKMGRPPREERIISGFEEIQRFCEQHGRAPQHGEDGDIFERLYAVRLDRLRAMPECVELLTPFDHQGLLASAPTAVVSAEDVDLDALAEELRDVAADDDITVLRHVRTTADKRAAEEIADRKPCEDFESFRPLFERAQTDINTGLRQLQPIGAGNRSIESGDFFLLDGITLYVAEVGEVLKTTANEADPRLRVIFANGTESNLLLRSLQRAFYNDPAAHRVVSPDSGQLSFGGELDADDVESGTVYVLRSLSDHPFVAEHRELIHKIGVMGGRVETRIANAEHDATYLLAKVEVVASYKLAGINRTRMERLFHRLFAPARLNITINDRFGHPVQPEEWFLVPLFIIDEAVDRIKDGSITGYAYDPQAAKLVELEADANA